jgi:Cu+-exporting ATPase
MIDSEKISKQTLFTVLDIILANFSEKPREKVLGIAKKKSEGVVQRVVFSVDGMSCSSCALYLEMLLTRNRDVMSASVDYSSKKGVVVGFLGLDKIVTIVDEHGYKVHAD